MSDPTTTRRVSRDGVALHGISYRHPALDRLLGEQVEARQPIACAATVEVFSEGRPFCTAVVDPWHSHDRPPSTGEAVS